MKLPSTMLVEKLLHLLVGFQINIGSEKLFLPFNHEENGKYNVMYFFLLSK